LGGISLKILIFSIPVSIYPHIVIWADIALKHQNTGDEVYFLYNDNYLSRKNVFTQQVIPLNNGLSAKSIPPENSHFINFANIGSEYPELYIPRFYSVRELKEFEVNGIDIGSAVSSSLITLLREPNPELVKYRKIYTAMIYETLRVYDETFKYLEQLKPDVFYIYNGRYRNVRSALRAAQKLGVKALVYEVSNEETFKYYFHENTYRHDLDYTKEQIDLYWNNSQNDPHREEYAAAWFQQKRAGRDHKSHIKEQSKNKLPDNFGLSPKNIVIYNSSQDEFESIKCWKNTIFQNQNEAIKIILDNFNDNNYHFYLRMHPNLKGIDNSQIKEIRALQQENLTVLEAGSPVDSYALLDAADKIISFGSTVGIEAPYWDKPSILIGRSEYEHLGSCYIPKNYQEIISLIRSELKPLPKEGAIKYGYYERAKGIEPQYYQPEAVSSQAFFHFCLADHLAQKNEVDNSLKEYLNSYHLFRQIAGKGKSTVFLALLLTIFRILFFIKKDFQEVAGFADQAFEIAPDYPEAIYNYGLAKLYTGKAEEATTLFQKAFSLISGKDAGPGQQDTVRQPGSSGILPENYLDGTGNNGDLYDSAVKLNQQSNPLARFPDNSELFFSVTFQLGRCLLLSGDQNGLRYLEFAVQLGLDNSLVIPHLIKYYIVRGDPEKALLLYDQYRSYIKSELPHIPVLAPDSGHTAKKTQLAILLFLRKLPVWLKQESEEIVAKIHDCLDR
jgi:tetratricopeptide (TPR) repeat protein